MPVDIDTLVRLIEKTAPLELAYDWDNSGLLLCCGKSVSRVMIALDATMEVAQEAIREGCDFLYVHHPLIFSPIKSLSCERPSDAVVMRLVGAGISLYAAHTSFDRVQGGINDSLATKLGLIDVRTVDGAGEALMRIGRLPKTYTADAFVAHVKSVFHIDCVRMTQLPCGDIKTVAMVGGSGGDFVSAAKNAGADVLITGEAKHQHHIEAAVQGVLLIEAGHYETEYVFVDRAFMSLQAELNAVQLMVDLQKAKCEIAPSVFR